MINGGKDNSDSIPIDLNEILSRLCAKSIARFRCKYFTELFLTRPRLLLALVRDGECSFLSLPQPQNRVHEKSSLVVTADFHIKFPRDQKMSLCPNNRGSPFYYASGVISFPNLLISQEVVHVICNPVTGQYAILPNLIRNRMYHRFLGFDPIGKKFKVLSMASFHCAEKNKYKTLTLVIGKMKWTKIQCPTNHEPFSEGICINGVLYYLAKVGALPCLMVCFDVTSEKFKFIDAKCCCDPLPIKLINYKGKLGGINWKYVSAGERRNIELRMCILEDVEKTEWSKYVYTYPENEALNPFKVYVAGVTTSGEIVFSQYYKSYQVLFYVFYLNPERNTLHSVEIQGFEKLDKSSTVYTFVNHVEDLKFSMSTMKSY